MTGSTETLLIKGFGIGGYKSFAPEMQWLHPLSQINLIIGENNLGKSNLLLLIGEKYKRVVEAAFNGRLTPFSNLDVNRNIEDCTITFGLPVGALRPYMRDDDERGRILQKLLSRLFQSNEHLLHFLEHPKSHEIIIDQKRFQPIIDVLDEKEWESLSAALTSNSGDELLANVRRVISRVFDSSNLFFESKPIVVTAKRECNRVRRQDVNYYPDTDYFDGERLSDLIANYKSSSVDADSKRKVFRRLERFVQQVLGNPKANLDIPKDADILQVIVDDAVTWKLEELGTGVHEIILLAAACTLHSKRVICIEEPEIHVHPSWQRRFIELLTETDNQYFIATHSAHIMDLPGVSVFHLIGGPDGTKVRQAVTAAHKVEVCASLGYRPSDLLQTNCVIWVEGPTDRAYLKHWISNTCPSLEEGRNYSLMFYGGSLRAYLTTKDVTEKTPDGEKINLPQQVRDLIELRSINQNLAIVMDSDKHSASDELKPVVRTLQEEFNDAPGFAWVTKGRSIENYFHEEDVLAAMRAVHPNSEIADDEGKEEFRLLCTLKTVSNEGKENRYSADKAAIAEHLIKSGAIPRGDMGLQEHIEKLIEFIKRANR